MEKMILEQLMNLSKQMGSIEQTIASGFKCQEKKFDEKLENMEKRFDEKIENMTKTFDEKLENMTKTYDEKLENMGKTFDEKLEKQKEEIVQLIDAKINKSTLEISHEIRYLARYFEKKMIKLNK